MAWFDDDWIYRMPLTFANHSGFGRFWDDTTGVLSNFNDVRITAADGVTLLDWAFHGGTPSKANRTATIQIDETNHNLSNLYGNAAASASVGAWLYWGNDAANLASGANNSINITTTPKAVHVDVANPRSSSLAFYLQAQPIAVGQSFYPHEIRKGTADTTRIYWDLSSTLLRLRSHNQSSLHLEEIAYVTCIIYDQDGANTTAAMTTLNNITILPGDIVQMPITACDHEKRYSIIMTFGLVDPSGAVRVTEQRATLHVRNTGLHPALIT